jgi:threonine dehydrogenase-like Zn-dependent dehydrogenase
VEEVPAPVAGAQDLILAVTACGICGSDLGFYANGGELVQPGQIMGHEFVGEVVAVGDAVSGVAVGDRVTGMPIRPCGECPGCRRGDVNLCAQALTRGIAYGRPGAFAEHVGIPDAVVDENVFILPSGFSDDAGALVEPLAVAVHAVRVGDPSRADTVAVFGLGPIGLQIVQALRARDVGRVVGIDLAPSRLEAAARLGALPVEAGPDAEATLAAVRAEGIEPDIAFECSGATPAFTAALEAVRPGGRVVAVALYHKPVPLDGMALVHREIELRGSVCYRSDDFREAIALLDAGSAVTEPLVTHREPLDRLPAAFEMQCRSKDAIKVMVAP